MASSVIRFEVLLPNTDNGTPDNVAVNTFMTSMQTLTTCYQYQTNSQNGQWVTFFGYITATQATAALGFLATLNGAISVTFRPIVAVSMNATSQP